MVSVRGLGAQAWPACQSICCTIYIVANYSAISLLSTQRRLQTEYLDSQTEFADERWQVVEIVRVRDCWGESDCAGE
jgi:hypothetical protein